MNLYLLKRDDDRVNWDQTAAMVIAARSSRHAREIASSAESPYGDEGPFVWEDAEQSPSKFLGKAANKTKAGVILRDFRAG